MKRVLAVVALWALAGCAGVPLEKQAVSIQDDQYSQSATFVGTKLADNPFGGVFKLWFIRSFVDKKTGLTTHQLYVETSYIGDWHFYQSAADDTATALPFIPIDRQVGSCRGGCDFDETFALRLEESALRARAATGFSVKVSAKDGTAFVVAVPSGQIQPQLVAIDNYKAAHNLVARATAPAELTAPTPSSEHPTLGVTVTAAPPSLTTALKIDGGLVVVRVSPGSAAERAGVKVGDILRKYGERDLRAPNDLPNAVAQTSNGAVVDLTVQRGMGVTVVPVKY
jgi:PDZ domain